MVYIQVLDPSVLSDSLTHKKKKYLLVSVFRVLFMLYECKYEGVRL